jgi:hypothetical protein
LRLRGLGLVKADQNIARIDSISVTHAQLPDDAASGVLHLLHARIDHDNALPDYGA